MSSPYACKLFLPEMHLLDSFASVMRGPLGAGIFAKMSFITVANGDNIKNTLH